MKFGSHVLVCEAMWYVSGFADQVSCDFSM